jgi:hypothetical protein
MAIAKGNIRSGAPAAESGLQGSIATAYNQQALLKIGMRIVKIVGYMG